MSEIYRLVKSAWKNAHDSGYRPEDFGVDKAVTDLADCDSDIARWLIVDGEFSQSRFNELLGAVTNLMAIRTKPA